MKSFNGLYEKMLEPDEIIAAIDEAAAGKRTRGDVAKVLQNKDGYAAAIAAKIRSGLWRPPAHVKSELQEGSHRKVRKIEKPIFYDEQIVHHMLMRQLRPIMRPRMYEYSCGSIPGRGPLYAVRAIKRWRDGYGGRKFYVAELDVKKFYDHVDAGVLKGMMHRLIRDKRFLALLDRVIDAAAPGLPLGFYTSPWLGNWYLTALDRYATQTLRPDHYLRYMDNVFIFSANKRKLHRIVAGIERFLGEKLHLQLNDSKQVFRFEYHNRQTGQVRGRAINALGFVVHLDRVTLRKLILQRVRAKANRMHRLHRCRIVDAAAMVSYMGWLTHTDTYGYYLRYIKPKVSIHYCKRRLATLARRKGDKNDKLERSTQQRHRASHGA